MAFSSGAAAQTNVTVSITGDSLLLSDVLKSIEKQADVHFAYDPEIIRDIRISISINQAGLLPTLNQIFQSTGVCYKESGKNHFLLYPCQSTSWNLTGVVKDRQTGEVLPFTELAVRGTNYGVLADRNGEFSLYNLQGDSAKLIISYIGYHPKEVSIPLGSEKVVLYLDRSATMLKGLELNVFTEFVNSGEFYSQLTINSNLLKGLPTLGEPDPIKSIKLLPGVGGNAETSTGIAMRGGKFDQTMILYDDFQLLHVDHFFGLFSTVNQNMVKDIQVYRSGYTTKYSGFTSGLVQITAKDGNANKVSGGFATNVYSSSAYLEVPLLKNKWSTAMSFRKDNGWISNAIWNDGIVFPHIENEIRVKSPSSANANDTEGSINFYDASFKTSYNVSEKHKITLSYFSSSDQVGTSYNNTTDSEEDIVSILELSSSWSNRGASVKWTHELRKNYAAELIYTYSRFNTRSNFDQILEVIEDDTLENLHDLGFVNSFRQEHYRYDAELKLPKGKWYFGTDITLFKSHFTAIDEEEEFTDNFSKILPAVYLEKEHKISNKFKVLFGSRVTFEDEFEELYLEPRMSAFYKFNKHFKSTFAYGIYYQHAKQYVPDERDGLIPDYWLLPDYELTFPTRAHIASAGMVYSKKRWMVNTELFYKNLDNTAEQFPSISDLFESNADYVKVLSSGRSTVLGGDVVIRKRFRKFSAWTGVGINQVKNTSDSVQSHDYQPYYTNLGDVKLGYLYSWKDWEAGLTWMWLGGRRYTDLQAAVSQLSQAQIGNETLPAYHRLDASVSYKVSFNKAKGAVRLTVFNVYNRENTRTINFTLLDSSPSANPEAIPVSTLGIRPNLTLELNF
jgi:hypothetical protein